MGMVFQKIDTHADMWRGLTGVYVLDCVENGKKYIGSAAKCFKKRLREHLALLRKGTHHSRHLQQAWNKYGEGSFQFNLLEICAAKDCIKREQFFIQRFNSADGNHGFNICKESRSRLGVKSSEITCRKIGDANRGRKHPPSFAAEISRRNKGSKRTAEQIAKMSAAMKGRNHTEETKSKMRGKKKSAEFCENARKRMLGKKLSPEQRAAMSACRIGIKHTPVQKIAFKAAMQKRRDRERIERFNLETQLLGLAEAQKRLNRRDRNNSAGARYITRKNALK